MFIDRVKKNLAMMKFRNPGLENGMELNRQIFFLSAYRVFLLVNFYKQD